MKASYEILKSRVFRNGFAISLLASAVCLRSLPVAAQDQPSQNTARVQQSDGQPTPDAAPQNGVPSSPAVPPTITLPAGTMIPVRISEWLSSDKNQSGDRFSASLEQPLVANGWVVAVRGQIVTGRVALAKKAGRVSGVSQLGVELSELTLVDGQVLPAQTQLLQTSAGTSNGREGAAIGAGAGAVAGIIGVLTTRGKATVIPPEAMLTFRLEVPLSISTERSQLAFQLVRSSDYRGDQDAYANRQRRVFTGPPYPRPYYYYPDPWYVYGYYPGPYIGFGSYGPRYYGGFHGGFRRWH